MANINKILYLFYRPYEPVYMGKGDENVRFDVPENYKVDQGKSFHGEIARRTYGTTIPVVPLDPLPDLSFVRSLTDDETFSNFRPECSSIAGKLIAMFMSAKHFDEFLSLAVYCRDRMNKHLFFYALLVTITHRPDCRGLNPPSYAEMFPSLYMDSSVINRARIQASFADEFKEVIDIPQNFTSTNLEAENKVAYFREDIAVNLHHMHWHEVYPHTGPVEIVQKDRRGELFYYMHQQIIARYNFERLSNGLNRVIPLNNLRDPIPEGYFPKIASSTNNRPYPSRSPNMKISDVHRHGTIINIEKLELWRNRIYEAIHREFVINSKGDRIKLGVPDKGDKENGIDLLGNMIESSILNVNTKYYGSFHNYAHDIIAHIHDPDNRYLEETSVMGNTATAMRDPIFYRLHAYIDDLFYEFKYHIPGYVTADLSFSNVNIKNVEVLSDNSLTPNQLNTFWQKSELNVSGGLDFAQPGSVFVRYTHLQHYPFEYKITIYNDSKSTQNGTVRIFLAPKYSEHDTEFTINEQARLFIELDKFTVTLKHGDNNICRKSSESSLTLPYDVVSSKNRSKLIDTENENCKCGWPQHMLIPKGSADGLECSLFVMVSDGDKNEIPRKTTPCKKDTSSYCGVIDELYPDSRAMGYPFDRPWLNGDDILCENNMTKNMFVTPVVIQFNK